MLWTWTPSINSTLILRTSAGAAPFASMAACMPTADSNAVSMLSVCMASYLQTWVKLLMVTCVLLTE